MNNNEFYVSIDIEADGPIPIVNSMLSLGAAAFSADGRLLDKFYVNLDTLPGAGSDSDTMEWWKKQPEAWAACRINTVDAHKAMSQFVSWIEGLQKKTGKLPVCVAYPAGYDWTFVYTYMIRFTGKSPFKFACLDIKTLAMALMNVPYRQVGKRDMPDRWKTKSPHTHVAVDDAIEQGEMFCNMLKELDALHLTVDAVEKECKKFEFPDEDRPELFDALTSLRGRLIE